MSLTIFIFLLVLQNNFFFKVQNAELFLRHAFRYPSTQEAGGGGASKVQGHFGYVVSRAPSWVA